jgi:hypothetical protein
MLPDIDFHRIRPFKDSRNKGFEELCVQLFRFSFPSRTKFYRVDDASGDGGVEDIAFKADGSKIGLQAKFFVKIGPPQWNQIDKSVITALRSHAPDLLEYRIACPCNRSKDSKSWNFYCAKWQTLANDLGYTKEVTFVWWGDTELRTLLIKQEHHDKVHYWFGCKKFSQKWLMENFRITEKLLDTRYTPIHHVRTESEKLLDAFFLTDEFEGSFWKILHEALSQALQAIDTIDIQTIAEGVNRFNEEIEQFRNTFSEERGLSAFSICHDCFRRIRDCTLDLYEKYERLREEEEKHIGGDEIRYVARPYSSQLTVLKNLLSSLRQAEDFIVRFKSYDSRKVLVLGNAGSGKSHLLASSVKYAINRNQLAILMLGEQFLSSDVPLAQLCRILGWDEGIESLLSALNTAASVQGKPAIIAIDALNESGERKLWKSHLLQTASQITQYSNIRLIVSCRTDFATFILPKSLSRGTEREWSTIEHQGFGDDVFQAVATYFKGYKVTSDHFPPILEEFQNQQPDRG